MEKEKYPGSSETIQKRKKVVTQQAAIDTALEFAREVRQQGIHLKKVFLFGSFAANRQDEYSDIDVALAADEFTGFGYEDVKLFLKILRKYTIIQPKTYSTDYFDNGDPFVEEIKKTGIEIKL